MPPTGSCSTQNRDEKRSSNEKSSTPGEGGGYSAVPGANGLVSRAMCFLIVGSQAGGAQKSRNWSLGSPAEREKQGNNQTACSEVRIQVGAGRNE